MFTHATTAMITLAIALSFSTLVPELNSQDLSSITITRSDARPPVTAPRENFSGVARVLPVFDTTSATRANGSYVTFDAGARSNWHTHPRGQILIVTEGVGRVQNWGGEVREIRVGDVVRIPPNVKHWHGASPSEAMTHLAIQEHLNGRTVQWHEQVTDAQYGMISRAGAAPSQPSRAQQLMGDIAPKLAELTDSVLFGDVWKRPGLSPRDRSLATVSALIATNRSDQLRSHMTLALQNGVTRGQLVETITHLAFYTGWPNAVTAVAVAREVFGVSR